MMKNIFKVTKVKKCTLGEQGRSRSFSLDSGLFYGNGDVSGTLTSYRSLETEDCQLMSIREAFDDKENSPGLIRKSESIQLPKNDCLTTKIDTEKLKEDKSWKFATWSHGAPRNNCRRHTFGSTLSLDKADKAPDNGLYKAIARSPAMRVFKSPSLPRNIIPRRKKPNAFENNNNLVPENTEEGKNNTESSKPTEEDPDHMNLALEKESLDPDFIETDCGLGFSSNLWYYGEIEVVKGFKKNLIQSKEDFVGTIIVRYRKFEDIVYSITYRVGGNLYSGEIPQLYGKYSLDFSDPDQPKFNSVEELVAHMIEKQFLQRVTFDWLLQNVNF